MAELNKTLAEKGLELADKAFVLDGEQFTADNPINTQTPSFEASLQAKVKGLGFKSEDLINLIFTGIKETLSSNKILKQNKPQAISYKIKNYDSAGQLAVLTAHFEGKVIYDVNLPYLAPQLVGKTKNQVDEILRSKAEIDKVEITLAPSWEKKFPWFASKISVKVAAESQ